MKKGIAGLMVIGFLVLAGCGDKYSVPSGVLPREKMQEVMWDMILADQYATSLAKDSAHLDLKLEHLRLYDQVFRLHDVSREEFRKSYSYYIDHPELNQMLFDSIVNSAGRLRTEIYSHPVVKPATTPTPAPFIAPHHVPGTGPVLLRPPVTPLKTPVRTQLQAPSKPPLRTPSKPPLKSDTTRKKPGPGKPAK